jgi:2-polyprenyl-3-methyl-5-hydroxy-6-metoxy-1,4-benzoquinol methylase
MPDEADIGKAYAEYYTHSGIPQNENQSGLRGRLIRTLRLIHDLILEATQISRERKRLALMYLDGVPPGRVLDVGCGDGSRLAQLRSLGWQVTGQEMDPKAASRAGETYGVRVHVGPLEGGGFNEGEFDAIVMNHVIEHVHDPIRLLTHCVRLLKKGGILIAVTPNADSCGHKRFGRFWRGLEPPRHIHLFNQRTLRQVAACLGFSQLDSWTTAAYAEVIANGSLEVRTSRKERVDFSKKVMRRVVAGHYQLRWQLAHMRDRNSGEECVLRAVI